MSCFTSLAILMSSSPSVLYPGLGTMAPIDILVPGTALDKIGQFFCREWPKLHQLSKVF